MANTPNFGWETPDNTDLVKDGAAAMRTLGDAIDASLVDLKGGTSGQVLSKNSNTDMDFVWVTSDDANAIQNAIVDAKGDLISATAADTPARLAVGNNGESLVADSSATTGLRWQGTRAGAKNCVINGGFDIWQRGTSFAGGGAGTGYSADRWIFNRFGYASGGTVSRQSSGLTGFNYAARVQRDSGNTSTANVQFSQVIETQETLPFAGQTVTLSFYARAGANFSAASSTLKVSVYTGTGTDQNNINGGSFTGSSTILDTSTAITTSWVRYSFNATLASTATEMSFSLYFTPVGTAGAADYFEITGVQIELGSVATAFTRAGGTIAGELAACQRYYYRNTAATNLATLAFGGVATSSSNCYAHLVLPVPLRVAATTAEFSTIQFIDTALSTYNISAITLSQSTTTLVGFDASISGATANRAGWIRANSSTSAYIAVGAEL